MEQTENLKELVREEAAKLREFATVEERGRLDFSKLDPGDSELCIYGQMDSSGCFGIRAIELLNLCAKPYSRRLYALYAVDEQVFERSIRRHFSPIEFYIAQSYAKNAELISYLKGETDILEL